MILLYTLILPISQLQAQQVITSQIRSRIEYSLYSCAHDLITIRDIVTYFFGSLYV